MAANLPRPLLDALLLKLSSDDAFRSLFRNDPRTALSQIGVRDDLDDHVAKAARCIFGGGLPSKEKLAGVRAQIAARESFCGVVVFAPVSWLCASNGGLKIAA